MREKIETKCPLVFRQHVNDNYGNIVKIEFGDREELIKNILIMSRQYSDFTFLGGDSYQLNCYHRKYRSSGDIYLHAKYYDPEIKLKDVMRILFNISDLLFGQYCDAVMKRVFKIKSPEILNVREYYISGKETRDEYYLEFKDWENI
jgi:hypothetical protein